MLNIDEVLSDASSFRHLEPSVKDITEAQISFGEFSQEQKNAAFIISDILRSAYRNPIDQAGSPLCFVTALKCVKSISPLCGLKSISEETK